VKVEELGAQSHYLIDTPCPSQWVCSTLHRPKFYDTAAVTNLLAVH
jgi:hypothetical protein